MPPSVTMGEITVSLFKAAWDAGPPAWRRNKRNLQGTQGIIALERQSHPHITAVMSLGLQNLFIIAVQPESP